jgi:hypothetical protein
MVTANGRLSASTLEALKSFMSERDEQQRRFEELRGKAEDRHDKRIVTMADFEEDWNQSQVTSLSHVRGVWLLAVFSHSSHFSSGTTMRRRYRLQKSFWKGLQTKRSSDWFRRLAFM